MFIPHVLNFPFIEALYNYTNNISLNQTVFTNTS